MFFLVAAWYIDGEAMGERKTRWLRAFAAPIGIHLRISKNVKLPPIHAFSLKHNKLPKLRTWVRFPSPAP